MSLTAFQEQAGGMIWVALDDMNNASSIQLIKTLAPFKVGYKLGHERIHAPGGIEGVIDCCKQYNRRVFLDAKLYDKPDTVRRAAQMIAERGVDYFTVAAEMGLEGLHAAVDGRGLSKVLAVTLLTSMSDDDCMAHYGMTVKERVNLLAMEAHFARVTGLICSALDIEELNKNEHLRDLIKITPGIRSKGQNMNDQKRVVTPGEAFNLGAHGMVIGGEVTQSPDPRRALIGIIDQIMEAMEGGS
jgi:orotidine-5'-phosphate decarboxylase